MIDKQLLLQGCKQFEIELSTQAAEQLDTYAQLLVEWNGKMNLDVYKRQAAMRRHRRVQRVRKKSIVRNWQRQERQTQKNTAMSIPM